jgi:hypothetical protein
MTLPLGSASSIERMLACPASCVLPQVDSTSDDADAGHAKHAYVNAVLTGTPPADALAKVPADLSDTCARLDWHALGGDLSDVRSEVAYAIDVKKRTARELGVNIGRAYHLHSLGENEIPGSEDIGGVTFDGVPTTVDVKSGWGETTRSDENGQLGFFAAAKHLITGSQVVGVRIAKLRDDGSVTPDASVLSAFEIESFLDELEAGAERVHAARRVYLAGGQVDVSMGAHCRNCPAMTHCPAHTRMALAMVGDTDALAAQVAYLDEAGATRAWLTYKQVKDKLEMVGDALKARARQRGITTDERHWVVERMTTRTAFDKDAAVALLQSFGASAEQIAGLSKESTFGVVREVLKPGAPKLPGRKKAKELA